MDFFQPIVFGLIQGLTEFLPISSSAHLILLPKFLDWTDPGLSFDVALHFGTLLAVGSYFWKDILEITSIALNQAGFKSEKINKVIQNSKYNNKIVIFLILATIPGAVTGYFLDDLAESTLRSPGLIVFTLVFFGGLLYWADTRSGQSRSNLKKLTFKDVILIGCAQALAIIPGTSRSGATITAGLLLGLTRTAAARFSFLMSMPIILGAVIYKTPDLIVGGIGMYEILGILASVVSGYLAIAGLMKFINKVSYKVFFWYRIILAVLVLIFLIM
jgi:undecaprenyl-diphosphatase